MPFSFKPSWFVLKFQNSTFFPHNNYTFCPVSGKTSKVSLYNPQLPDFIKRQVFNTHLPFMGPYITNIFAEHYQQNATFHNSFISVRRSTTTAWRVFRLRIEERSPIRRVAANKLNKQSRRADEGWSSSLGFGRSANYPSL